MNQLEEARAKIGECDNRIIDALIDRMAQVQKIIAYKKAAGIPILEPEQEAKQTKVLEDKLADNEFEDEILDIFKYIIKYKRRHCLTTMCSWLALWVRGKRQLPAN